MGFWFQQNSQKRREKGSVKFLRKGPAMRRMERTVVKQSGRRFRVDIFLLWGTFAGTLVYLGVFSTFFRIADVAVAGSGVVTDATVKAFVEREVTGTYFGIVPKNGFFTVRPQTLEAQLRAEYPLFATVEVRKSFPDRLRVTVTERKKIVVLCSGESCFLVDEIGTLHANERVLSSDNIPFVLFVTDMSAAPIVPETRALDPQYVSFVVLVSELFPERLNIALEPRYAMTSRFANEVRVKTEEGWEVYFGTEIPLGASLQALELILERELPKAKRATLAYVDLRTENRAYYSLREETLAVPTSAVPVSEEKKGEKKDK